MTLNRKYSALPDLDTAPDIYETPDLTDDNSTIPTATGPSQSDHEFDDDEETGEGISRTRLRIDQARSRFVPSQVDARDVDFSDRLHGKRKSYKTSSRRHRILDDGTYQIGDASDDDGDGENLERKLARLKREVEEAREEYERKQADPPEDPVGEHDIDSLSHALDEMTMVKKSSRPDPAQHDRTIPSEPRDGAPAAPPSADGATYTVTYTPDYEQGHALAKAADFDRRLLLLEKTIGIASSAAPELDSDNMPRAIMPTLDTLQRQIGVLSEASTSSLDSISRRVRNLTSDAEALEKQRKAARAAQEALLSPSGGGGDAAAIDDSEQSAKINALYGTLPTIENLAPLLPSLLDRLRSLRAIHADAATASETLEQIEKSQAEMATEIQLWREGLDRLEGVLKESDESMVKNNQVVEGWVEELEAKMVMLS